jgi:hypothetical protein
MRRRNQGANLQTRAERAPVIAVFTATGAQSKDAAVRVELM